MQSYLATIILTSYLKAIESSSLDLTHHTVLQVNFTDFRFNIKISETAAHFSAVQTMYTRV